MKVEDQFQQGEKHLYLYQYSKAILYFKQAAEGKYPPAYLQLGAIYREGIGVDKDAKQSEQWYQKARDQIQWFQSQEESGDPEKLYYLAQYYLRASNEEIDKEKAFRCYQKSAEQGHVAAQSRLGWCYRFGIGTVKDEKQAVIWYRKAADQGCADAQSMLGMHYLQGIGIVKDEKQGVIWLRKAAKQGSAGAQAGLGLCYRLGMGIEKDEKQSVIWFRKAADQGYADAQHVLGEYYQLGIGIEKDEKQATNWYRKAAEQGFAKAQVELGTRYQLGKGIVKDEKEGAIWFRRAAEQGNIEAQSSLGLCYRLGIGIEKDEKQAVIWNRRAAEQGNAIAQFALGLCYESGVGIGKDEKEAAFWYYKAAEQGIAEAQFVLGYFYQMGIGIEKNREQAIIWYQKAALQGHMQAIAAYGYNSLMKASYDIIGSMRVEMLALAVPVMAGWVANAWGRMPNFFNLPGAHGCEINESHESKQSIFERVLPFEPLSTLSSPLGAEQKLDSNNASFYGHDITASQLLVSCPTQDALALLQIPASKLGKHRNRKRELTEIEIQALKTYQSKIKNIEAIINPHQAALAIVDPALASETQYILKKLQTELTPAIRSGKGSNLLLEQVEHLFGHLEKHTKAIKKWSLSKSEEKSYIKSEPSQSDEFFAEQFIPKSEGTRSLWVSGVSLWRSSCPTVPINMEPEPHSINSFINFNSTITAYRS